MMKKKIVVLTGSFNPITKAHRMIVENAVNKVGADLGLLFIVSDDYLKNKIIIKKKENRPFILSEDLRKKMIDSLGEEFPKIKFGGVEVGGLNPATVKTLKKVKKTYKDYDIYFSIGADKLQSISHWTDIESIFNDLYLIVYPRVGYDIESIINNDTMLLNHKEKIIILDDLENAQGISSTKIRELFFKELDYRALMDKGPYSVLKELRSSDYKEITGEELIKNYLLYGGRFNGNLARKQVYKVNTQMFTDWNSDLLGDRNNKVLGTKVYAEEFVVNSDNNFDTHYSCENIDCSELALKLINKGLNPAILNLASNRTPCGGYFDGAGAQEESLCQMSTLSVSLYQFGNPKLKCFKDAKVEAIPGVYPMNLNFGGIYSPEVCFFRYNMDKDYSLREKVFECSVISVSSLSNKVSDNYVNEELKYFNEDGFLTEEGKEIEMNKIRTIYRIALDNGHDSLVLGALGCGDFRMKSEEVSLLFKKVLEEKEFKNKFKEITFAIYEGEGSSRKIVGKEGKFKAFYDIFG